jgi:ribonucleoside-diphosphate reductase beta chain
MTTANEIIAARRIAFGPKDMLMNMSRVKYGWAVEIHERMLNNFWTTKAVELGTDRMQYRDGTLSAREKRAYDYSLAFVSNLDGFQFNNLVENIGGFITAPEISGAIARQAAEEYLHVRTYQTMIEAVSLDPQDVYMLFERDGMLAAKNEFIRRNSAILKEEGTPAAFARAVVANVNLEGIHFYAPFLVFYTLARGQKMKGSADFIKYINRDEGGTHLDLFTEIHHGFRAENPEVYDAEFVRDARQLIRNAVEQEIVWGKYIIDGGFLGLTDAVLEHFVMGRGNKVSEMLGLGKLYDNVQDSAPWFDKFSVPGAKTNFFERKVTDYQAGGLDW